MTELDYKHYTITCQHISNYLNHSLSATESRVLLFIVNRTIRFGKRKEKIPMRHFLEGVVTKKGKPIIGGVGASARSIQGAFKSLAEKNLIKIRIGGGKGTNYFTLAIDNVWRLINMAVDKLKLSRKRRKNTPAYLAGPPRKRAATNKEEDIEIKERSKQTPAQDPLRTLDAIHKGKKQNEEAVEKKVNAAHLPTLPNLRAVWKRAVADYKLDHPAAKVLEAPQKTYMKLGQNLHYRYGDNPEWKNVIYKAITEWDELIEYFNWMDKLSPTPSMMFIQNNFMRVSEFADRKETVNILDTKRTEELKAIRKAASASKEVQDLFSERDKLIKEIGYAKSLLDEEQGRDYQAEKESKLTDLENTILQQSTEIRRLRSLSSFEEAESHDLPEWDDREQ